jgi:hypothetical protein
VETVFDIILEAHSKGGHAKGTYILLFFGFLVSVFLLINILLFVFEFSAFC